MGYIFPIFTALVILLLVLPSNFIVSGVKNSGQYPVFILNVILFYILFTYFLREYDPSGNFHSFQFFSFHVGTDILNLLSLYDFENHTFIFFLITCFIN